MPTFYRPSKRPRGRYVAVVREFSELEKKTVKIVIESIRHLTISQQTQPGRDVIVRIEYTQLATDFDQIAEAADWLSSWRIKHKKEGN